jgi:hypothetical protein
LGGGRGQNTKQLDRRRGQKKNSLRGGGRKTKKHSWEEEWVRIERRHERRGDMETSIRDG